MRCISLWQPWASAMALGLKRNETRPWKTSHRGPLVIHAAKKIVPWPSITIQSFFADIAFQPSELPRGCLLCIVDLIDCQKISIHNRPQGVERDLGDYTPGRYVWITDNVRIFEKPIPFRGRQGIFYVPDQLIKERK